MIVKDTLFIGWKIYKRHNEHFYCLGYEPSKDSIHSFYLYPKAAIHDGEFYEDRLHQQSRYTSCTSSWHKRNFLNHEIMSVCSWWNVEHRAPKEWVEFLRVELDRILFCNCFPKSMGRGSGAPFQFCDQIHLKSVDASYSLIVE